MNFSDLLRQQRQYINTQQTLSIAARKSTLLRFKQMLEENEAKIYEAVHADFHKSAHEAFLTEYAKMNEFLEQRRR